MAKDSAARIAHIGIYREPEFIDMLAMRPPGVGARSGLVSRLVGRIYGIGWPDAAARGWLELRVA
jgi:hypothetical protein